MKYSIADIAREIDKPRREDMVKHWTERLLTVGTATAAGYWIVRCLQGVM